MTEGDAMAGGKSARFKQRVFHAGNLLLHGLERLPDDGGAHFTRAQITHLLDLQKVKKGITFGSGYQFGLFPSCQLTRRDPKYAKQIRSTISVHVDMGTLLHIIDNRARRWQ